MKIAIFSDVHGNLIALEKFIEVTRNTVDSYLCLGDVVNYGPWNNECLEIVLQLPGITLLEGNHERLFLEQEKIEDECPLVQSFFEHAIKSFSRKDLITDLPQHKIIDKFKCLHAINGKYTYQDSTLDIDRDYIVGHSHHQFQTTRLGFTVLNPGSVGQNRRWIDEVNYLIFNAENLEAQLFSVWYDVDRFIAELYSRNYPKECTDYYNSKPRKNARI